MSEINNLPKITIITPSLNQGNYIEKTIQSVIDQNYTNLEYIIIDGGSTDNSIDIIKNYSHSIDYWISEKDSGQSDAINKGLRRATGDIITWLNSDDQLMANSLQKVVEIFKTKNVEIVHGDTLVYGLGIKDTIAKSHQPNIEQRYLSGMPFSQPSAFFSKKALQEQGLLNERLNYGMDYDLFVRFALNYKIEYIEATLSKYLIHKASKTYTSDILFANEWAEIFSKVLRSIPEGKDCILHLKQLGLYSENEDSYTVSKKFTKEHIFLSFKYFLFYQVYFRYRGLQLNKVIEIISYLKKIDSAFVNTNKMNKTLWKAKLPFSKDIIRLYRKIS